MVDLVSPSSQSISNNPDTQIEIVFNSAIDDTSIELYVFGRWSGPMTGIVELVNNNQTLIFSPDDHFFYGEWITVTLSKQIQSESGDFLENGYQWGFWTKTNLGNFVQENPTVIELREDGEGQIQSYGAYAGDINNDGTTDLVVVNEISNDVRILENDISLGYTDFEILALDNANKPSTNEGADFNNDGFIDLAIGSTQNNIVNVLYGNDQGFGSQSNLVSGNGIRGLTVLDFNGDGWMDIVTANRAASNIALFENQGNGEFNPAVLQEVPNCNGETAISAADFNNDGMLDLAIGCFSSGNVVIMINEGSGNFILMDEENANSNPWMVGIGDVNNDGNVDLVSANSGTNNVSVYFGNGDGSIEPPLYFSAGGFPLAIDLGDLDGDQDLDLACSNFFSDDFTILENVNSGNFDSSYTLEAQLAGSCAVFHDHNNDGIMDLTCIDEIADVLFIYTNFEPNTTSLFEIAEDEFSIYPNPSPGDVRIDFDDSTKEFFLHDEQGKFIQMIQVNKSLDLSNLSSGTYFIVSPSGESRKLILK